jgi:hypothetical protein
MGSARATRKACTRQKVFSRLGPARRVPRPCAWTAGHSSTRTQYLLAIQKSMLVNWPRVRKTVYRDANHHVVRTNATTCSMASLLVSSPLRLFVERLSAACSPSGPVGGWCVERKSRWCGQAPSIDRSQAQCRADRARPEINRCIARWLSRLVAEIWPSAVLVTGGIVARPWRSRHPRLPGSKLPDLIKLFAASGEFDIKWAAALVRASQTDRRNDRSHP